MSLHLRACGPSNQKVKVWRKEDAIEMLFEDVKDMAESLTVGVPSSRVSLRVKGEVTKAEILVLSPSLWAELWERKIQGAIVIPASRLAKAFHYDLHDEVVGGEEGQSSQQQQQQQQQQESSTQGENAPRAPPSNASPTSLDLHIDAEKTPGHVGSDLSNLEIVIMAATEPGFGLREGDLRLAPLPENRCCLSATLRLVFSMHVQPKALSTYEQKLLDLDISSVFELLGESIVQVQNAAEESNEEACNTITRVGIAHDSLHASFHCRSSTSAALWASRKAGISSMSVTEKLQTGSSKATEFGLNVGGVAGHPGAGTFQIMGNLKHTRQSMHNKEKAVTRQVDSIEGTNFYIINNCQRRPTSFDILSYEAAYKPSLGSLTSLEEVGFSMQDGERMDAALGQTTTLEFNGKFVLEGKGLNKYNFIIRRRLGEMVLMAHLEKSVLKRLKNKGEKNWLKRLTREMTLSSEIELGDQEYILAFFINHAFDLSLYEGGRLFKKVRHLLDCAVADIILPVEEQQAVAEEQQVARGN